MRHVMSSLDRPEGFLVTNMLAHSRAPRPAIQSLRKDGSWRHAGDPSLLT